MGILINQDKTRPLTDTCEIYAENGILHIGYTDKKISVVETYPCATNIDNCLVGLTEFKSYKWDSIDETDNSLILRGIGEFTVPKTPYRELPIYIPQGVTATEVNAKNIFKRHKNFSADELNAFLVTDKYIVSTDSDTICCTYQNSFSCGIYDIDVFRVLGELNPTFFAKTRDGYYIESDNTKVFIKSIPIDYPEHLILPLLTPPTRNDIIIAIKSFKELVKYFNACNEITFKQGSLSSANIDIPLNNEFSNICTVDRKTLTRILTRMKGMIHVEVNETNVKLSDELGFYIIGGMKK
nr:MAG TPA: hypothetical protein [Caudoviricetes sp.]